MFYCITLYNIIMLFVGEVDDTAESHCVPPGAAGV